MAILKLLDQKKKQVTDPSEIKKFLNDRGIIYEQWTTDKVLHVDDDQETVARSPGHRPRGGLYQSSIVRR